MGFRPGAHPRPLCAALLHQVLLLLLELLFFAHLDVPLRRGDGAMAKEVFGGHDVLLRGEVFSGLSGPEVMALDILTVRLEEPAQPLRHSVSRVASRARREHLVISSAFDVLLVSHNCPVRLLVKEYCSFASLLGR